ncbi:ImmA/IrrE family metallo-endopeptidase [Nocardia brasiliensis]|uniref:ImmA/IrrE family metallo-endopeptidase n=1 Tax=Nocardia brasiliensis TaxID=37326 RepID=UPI002454FB84|nr:ImmA/IrrE family metallo-endopeptidase [Nocardia brasiliensis]
MRALIPKQSASRTDSLRLAREQAEALLHTPGRTDLGPIDLITESLQLRVEVCRDQHMPRASFWDVNTRQWVIQLRSIDSWKDQRFHIAHEFKHILDQGYELTLYPDDVASCELCDAEQTADYFARYLLVPDRTLRRVWGAGLTNVSKLAECFVVSEDVIRGRLRDIGYDRSLHPGTGAHRHSKSSPSRRRSTAR